ncbi:hypothetical protein ARMGADRAFT_1070737 [Armillaria gallica]|uniref:Aminoglycoside phosphotransferase domain-containing protein n=1 Tax=Armillaria gallica TaxID=47427 RepID=A0A2H3EDE2_ARMGA|nr:hypothetical protein ARMGADRAFT_1070737 [Armillaria gallica]
MSASNMLIESPEKPSITCFLDWQDAIVSPVFMQASIPALLAYTDGVFELSSEECVPSLLEDTDQRPSDEQEYLWLHQKLLSRCPFHLTHLPNLVPIHAAA